MKKLVCVLLCLMMVLPIALAENTPRQLSPDEPLYTSLYERSMELAWLFNEALHSEGYLALFTANEFGEPLEQLQMQDFTQPWDVVIIRADQTIKNSEFGSLAEIVPGSDFSMALEVCIWQKVYHTAANILNAREGMEVLSLSSLLVFSDAYICPEELDGPCFAVMQYGGLYAFLITFYPTVNGTVTAHAQFIPSRAVDELNLPVE